MAAEAKTKPTAASVADFIAVPDPLRRADAGTVAASFKAIKALYPD